MQAFPDVPMGSITYELLAAGKHEFQNTVDPCLADLKRLTLERKWLATSRAERSGRSAQDGALNQTTRTKSVALL